MNVLPSGTILKGKSYQYTILKVLGQGTFGITYLASVKMTGALGSINAYIKVAIKEFFMQDINGRSGTSVTSGSKGGVYDDYKKKFAREALNLSKLQHPNIIKVVESFESNNTVYYVMEYIEGGNLDDYILKEKGLEEDAAVRLIRQIGGALSYMHGQKMLHLDLKPKNVMLRKDGEAVLIDFGLSKQYNAKGEPESSTRVGQGTPGYAPIEQASYRDGKGFPVTMDVYALGATMFKMLTAVRPPEASEILNEGFPLYELQAHKVSDSVCASVAKAMAPLKKDRYPSVKAFLDSLEEESTIWEGNVRPDIRKDQQMEKDFCVRPDTGMVQITHVSIWNGKEEEDYSVKVDSKGVVWGFPGMTQFVLTSLTNKSYKDFLHTLQSMNLDVREEEVKSEEDFKTAPNETLKIQLYDKDGLIYHKLWTDSYDQGNIIGDVSEIEKKVRVIVPGLDSFIKQRIKEKTSSLRSENNNSDIDTNKVSLDDEALTASQMNLIGDDYFHGRNGKTKDYSEALKWYRKSAEQGNADGQDHLGLMYEKGYGVDQDNTKALIWYEKAAAQGNNSAKKHYEQLKQSNKEDGDSCLVDTFLFLGLGIHLLYPLLWWIWTLVDDTCHMPDLFQLGLFWILGVLISVIAGMKLMNEGFKKDIIYLLVIWSLLLLETSVLSILNDDNGYIQEAEPAIDTLTIEAVDDSKLDIDSILEVQEAVVDSTEAVAE